MTNVNDEIVRGVVPGFTDRGKRKPPPGIFEGEPVPVDRNVLDPAIQTNVEAVEPVPILALCVGTELIPVGDRRTDLEVRMDVFGEMVDPTSYNTLFGCPCDIAGGSSVPHELSGRHVPNGQISVLAARAAAEISALGNLNPAGIAVEQDPVLGPRLLLPGGDCLMVESALALLDGHPDQEQARGFLYGLVDAGLTNEPTVSGKGQHDCRRFADDALGTHGNPAVRDERDADPSPNVVCVTDNRNTPDQSRQAEIEAGNMESQTAEEKRGHGVDNGTVASSREAAPETSPDGNAETQSVLGVLRVGDDVDTTLAMPPKACAGPGAQVNKQTPVVIITPAIPLFGHTERGPTDADDQASADTDAGAAGRAPEGIVAPPVTTEIGDTPKDAPSGDFIEAHMAVASPMKTAVTDAERPAPIGQAKGGPPTATVQALPPSDSRSPLEIREVAGYDLMTHVARLQAAPFEQTVADLIAGGVGPQIVIAQLVNLAKASAYAGRPLSLQVRGYSADGKSTVVGTVMRFHPSNDQLQLMDLTWPALMGGLGRGGDLRHCIIVLDENVEGRKTDAKLAAALRELTTKERVTRIKEVRGASQQLTLMGPAVVIDTTLIDTKLSYQDASRFLVVAVKSDQETKRAIARLNDERFDPAGQQRRSAIARASEAHQVFLAQNRKDLTIYKPAGLRGTGRGHRFDSAVHSLVCAAAWLDQHNLEIGPGNSITASVQHYEYVWTLLRQAQVLAADSELTNSAAKTLTRWQDYTRRQGDIPASTTELHKVLAADMDPGAFSRLVKELREMGYVHLAHRGARGQHFLQLTPLGASYCGCDLVALLPTPEQVQEAQECAGLRNGQLVQQSQVTPNLRDSMEVQP